HEHVSRALRRAIASFAWSTTAAAQIAAVVAAVARFRVPRVAVVAWVKHQRLLVVGSAESLADAIALHRSLDVARLNGFGHGERWPARGTLCTSSYPLRGEHFPATASVCIT